MFPVVAFEVAIWRMGTLARPLFNTKAVTGRSDHPPESFLSENYAGHSPTRGEASRSASFLYSDLSSSLISFGMTIFTTTNWSPA